MMIAPENHLIVGKVGEDELVRVREKEVLVQLPLEVLPVGVSLASAPGAIQEPPGAGNEDGVPSVVDPFSGNENVAWKISSLLFKLVLRLFEPGT